MKTNFEFECETSESQAFAKVVEAIVSGETSAEIQRNLNEAQSMKIQNGKELIKGIFEVVAPLIPLVKGLFEKKAGLLPVAKKVNSEEFMENLAKAVADAFSPVFSEFDKRLLKIEKELGIDNTKEQAEAEAEDKEPETETETENPS